MTQSRLKLNADKMGFLVIGSERQCEFFLSHIHVLNQHVMPVVSTLNVGVLFYDTFI